MSEATRCEGIDNVENFCWGDDYPPEIQERRCLFVAEPGIKLCGKHAFIEANKPPTAPEETEQEKAENAYLRGETHL